MDKEEIQKRQEGIYYSYIWKWNKNKETPDNWIVATPIKVLGFCIGWKIKRVQSGYEKYYFTTHY